MKKFFIVLVFLIIGSVMSFGQAVTTNSTYTIITGDFVGLQTSADTLSCSSAADTSTWTPGYPIYTNGQFEYTCEVDSISGATGATGYLETSATGGASDDEWDQYATFTINGSGHTEYRTTGRLYGKYIRDRIYAPSSTQSTRLIRKIKWRKD